MQPEKNRSQWWRYLLLALIGVGMLGTVFGAGFFVGRRSVRSRGPSAPSPQRAPFFGRHGAVGQILQIEETTITLETRDHATQIILTDNRTRLERGAPPMTKMTLRDLEVGDQIVVVGTPNAQGQIRAGLIRVLSAPALTPTPTGL